MRNSKRGAVPVISQLWRACVIANAAWGERGTNSGSGARCGLRVMRFELTSDPTPLWALCRLQLTSHRRGPPGEFVLDSRDTTRGDFGKKSVFWDLFSLFPNVGKRIQNNLRARHLITLYDWENNSYPPNPTFTFLWDVFHSIKWCEKRKKTYQQSPAVLVEVLRREKVKLVSVCAGMTFVFL